MESTQVLEKWEELKTLVESLDQDVSKNAKGTASAGVRARKGLRLLKSKVSELVKLTVELGKAKKAAKAAEKDAEKPAA